MTLPLTVANARGDGIVETNASAVVPWPATQGSDLSGRPMAAQDRGDAVSRGLARSIVFVIAPASSNLHGAVPIERSHPCA